ncbi:MAG TPA: NAD-dependent protein deacetylase [Pseudomonadales bacterium]|nr:NAD-dependent protein deacetylase [Pseudomonadales bacterium]
MPPVPARTVASIDDLDTAVAALEDFLARHPRPVVLTGAGCSTESGIPDYRDTEGAWKRRPPVQFQDFVRSEHGRRRYWARSMLGYPFMARARPNATHRWLAARETAGGLPLLVTQNVDGLHARAGSRALVDLHGTIHAVICLDCGLRSERAALQARLAALNPAYVKAPGGAGTGADDEEVRIAPDGDAEIDDAPLTDFRVPDCERCGGMLKPDVVFFGESVPRERVDRTRAALADADALLVLGSSLMVYSGFRFCRDAAALGKPIAVVNLGRTRADDLLALSLQVSCGDLFERLSATARGSAARG